MAWVYIVRCANGAFYTGSTLDLERRLAQHNLGEGSNFTRKHRPVELVFAEASESVETAFVREKQIQGWSRAKKQALIDGRLEDLPALARRFPSTGSGNEPVGR
ncbi:GIY-YIG nuclease family protein [Parafrigoribacterium soli]|uniref:GIY-YIG nuclease family protein n=1 Tax=Parafrigoribacterium soli TaxID=3144663 RepID=UPI0032EFF365